jgi:hypothetical protein
MEGIIEILASMSIIGWAFLFITAVCRLNDKLSDDRKKKIKIFTREGIKILLGLFVIICMIVAIVFPVGYCIIKYIKYIKF